MEVLQVQNCSSEKIHLYTCEQLAVCSWPCGRPTTPVSHATFFPSHDSLDPVQNFHFICERCYTPTVAKLLKHLAVIPPYDDLRTQVYGVESDSSSDNSAISNHSEALDA